MKKIFLVIVCIFSLLLITGCESSNLRHVEINIKDKGIIKVELDESAAPITVKNFIKLAKSGFYDGLSFHRVIDGFMIQGGSPTYDTTGSSNERIKGEFLENGVDNQILHKRGVISMARGNDYNSGSCQFFIMHQDNNTLDGKYAAFGHVTEGMDIVDDIAENTVVEDNNGTVLKENQAIIESIKVID